MKLLVKISLLFCLLSFSNVEITNISDAQFKATDIEFYSHLDNSYNDNSSFVTQKISSTNVVTPRFFEYNFNYQRGELKNNSFQKAFSQVFDSCKALQAIHLEKGAVYHALHYIRYTSKYYIYALRHIII